ncbi:PxKF domain-containing protein, partial [Streptomyces sp. NPDC001774]
MTFTAGPASAAEEETFSFTGAVQQWEVPAGVTSITVEADGGQGGENGGLGAHVVSVLAVTPGQELDIYVGGAADGEAGGFNGGGAGREHPSGISGGGGGASDIRPSGGGAADRLVVAAGGGGSSGAYPSPAAGGAAGAAGADGADSPPVTGGQGGEPGTATAGGAGGTGGTGGPVQNNGSDGSLAAGGTGGLLTALALTGHNGGGGGGAGLYGGGGGGAGASNFTGGDVTGGGGGGGGSSLDPDGGAAPTAAPAGNGQVTITYEAVTYAFTGFFAPVDNPPVVNEVNAGRTVPVKFSLGGDQGLDILAPNSPSSQQVTCNSSAPVDVVETTTSQSGLTYNSSTDQYQYNWKTQKAWSGTCR